MENYEIQVIIVSRLKEEFSTSASSTEQVHFEFNRAGVSADTVEDIRSHIEMKLNPNYVQESLPLANNAM